MTEFEDVLERHGYHELRVKSVVMETADTRSFVLDVPDELRSTFAYRPGQFCTFRLRLGDDEVARCYSMSSAPETDRDLTVTVKRVPGGVMSNWLNDHVSEGDVLEVTRPAGAFCVRPGEHPADRPIVAFCGGSGVTPVLSIAKSALSGSTRPVRILYANRDRDSVIFEQPLSDLLGQHASRFHLQLHFDSDGGFLDAAAIREFVGDLADGTGPPDADFYICGPGPFMDLVEATLIELGVERAAIFIERFATVDPPPVEDSGSDDVPADAAGAPETIVLIVRGKRHELPYRAGDTVLGTARRATLSTPYSCEAGSCATCMALIREGSATMRTNDALEADEVEDGWVLTCQAQPTSRSITIEFNPR